MSFYNFLRYDLVPPIFLLVFTISVHIFAILGSGHELTWENYMKGLAGNYFSWVIVVSFISWAVFWLKICKKTYTGPRSPEGQLPVYKENPLQYFISTIALCLLLDYYKQVTVQLYMNMTYILGSLNITALCFCTFLYLSAKNDEKLPKFYLFYRGKERHPRIMGLDVKQFTNCRIGMTLWPTLCMIFFIASYRINGTFNFPAFVTMILQVVYSFKFFLNETRYFHTIDIMLDRAGYYLCWGCIVWMPTFFTFNSYYYVKYPPVMDNLTALFFLFIGLLSIFIQEKIDSERFNFRKAFDNKSKELQRYKYLSVEYVDPRTKEKKDSALLISGFWGMGRHLNYTCEIIYTISLTAPGLNLGIGPWLFPIFMFILILHRIYRDDDKCRAKYGSHWNEYCKKVPYILIPYVI